MFSPVEVTCWTKTLCESNQFIRELADMRALDIDRFFEANIHIDRKSQNFKSWVQRGQHFVPDTVCTLTRGAPFTVSGIVHEVFGNFKVKKKRRAIPVRDCGRTVRRFLES